MLFSPINTWWLITAPGSMIADGCITAVSLIVLELCNTGRCSKTIELYTWNGLSQTKSAFPGGHSVSLLINMILAADCIDLS